MTKARSISSGVGPPPPPPLVDEVGKGNEGDVEVIVGAGALSSATRPKGDDSAGPVVVAVVVIGDVATVVSVEVVGVVVVEGAAG